MCFNWLSSAFVTVIGDHHSKDVFAHYSAIKVANDQFRYLVQGEYVEFDLLNDASGKHEFVVGNIKGESLMCEVQNAQKKVTINLQKILKRILVISIIKI